MSISNRRKIVFASLAAVLGVQLVAALFFWPGTAWEAIVFFLRTYLHIGLFIGGCFAAYALIVLALEKIGYYSQDDER